MSRWLTLGKRGALMYNKLIVGRYLDIPAWNNMPPATDGMGSPAGFTLVDGRNYTLAESQGSGFLNLTRTSAVAPAVAPHSKAHRNFRWLPWVPGKITYAPISGTDILTGPFTGCWVVIFRMGAQVCLGHIGTKTDAMTPESLAVKAAWADAVRDGLITPMKATQPHTAIPLPQPGDRSSADAYAVATSAQDLAVVVMRNFSTKGGGRQLIGSVTDATNTALTAPTGF